MGFGREKSAIDLIGRGNEGREEGVVYGCRVLYGYVNENGNEGNHGRTLVRLWLTGSVVADVCQWNGCAYKELVCADGVAPRPAFRYDSEKVRPTCVTSPL